MKHIIFCLISALSFNSYCQTLGEIEKAKNDSILAQFQEKDDLKILALLPSVGYDALNNSLTVGFNISQFSNYLQTRRRNKIELAKLENQLKENSKIRIEKNFERLEKYLSDFQEFKIHLSSLTLYENLFEIAQGKYKSGEITTEQFLKEKLILSNQYLGFYSQISKLAIEANTLDQIFYQNTFFIEVETLKQNLLQRGKNFGVLGAEPLSFSGKI